jgi:hypothetical protein
VNTVDSKYKNPDKYIQGLKDEIARLGVVNNTAHKLREKAQGTRLFFYTDGGSRFEETVNIENGKKIKIGATLKLTGQVKKLEIVGDKIEYRVALVEVFELED